MIVKGAPTLVLNNISLINNGYFATDSSRVLFTGDAFTASSTIGGSIPISFYDLTIGKSAYDVRLNNNAGIRGHIIMSSGNLQLDQYTLDLGSSGSITGERSNSFITGKEGGNITATALLMTPRGANPGNIGVEINSPENPGWTVITRGHVPQMNTNGSTSIQRYFDIKPAMNSHLHATLRFFYLDGEIGENNKEDLAVFSNADRQPEWLARGRDASNTSANWVTKGNMDELHRFTLAVMPSRISGKAFARVYPNPAHETFTVVLSSTAEKDVLIYLYDQAAHVLEMKKIHCQPGTNTVEWRVAAFAAGTYYLSFKNMEVKPIAVFKQ